MRVYFDSPIFRVTHSVPPFSSMACQSGNRVTWAMWASHSASGIALKSSGVLTVNPPISMSSSPAESDQWRFNVGCVLGADIRSHGGKGEAGDGSVVFDVLGRVDAR